MADYRADAIFVALEKLLRHLHHKFSTMNS